MELINPLDNPKEWDREVRAFPGAGVFHTAAWAALIHRTYGHQPCFLRMPHGDGGPALIPLMEVRSPLTGVRGVSQPFADETSPLVPDGVSPDLLLPALEALSRDRGWKYLELRGMPDPENPSADPTFHGHELDLTPGPDRLWAGCAGSVRRAVRKAEHSGLTVRIARDESALRQFFALHSLTRRRHGLPPQPWTFFRNFLGVGLVGPEAGLVVLAEEQGLPVAAAVFLRHGDRAVYKFGASDPGNRDGRPNQLVMWEAIRFLAGSGIRSLNFGRTSVGQEGLRRFKLSWGAVEYPVPYRRFHPKDGTWRTLRPGPVSPPAGGVFRHMPVLFNQWAGRRLYPHLD